VNAYEKKTKWLVAFIILFVSYGVSGCNKNTLVKELKKEGVIIGREVALGVGQQIKAGNFREVEQFFDYLNELKPMTIDGIRLLENVYNILGDRDELISHLDKWCNSGKPHYAAFIIRGNYYIEYASKARGGDLGYTVTDERRNLFRERIEKAKKDLETAYYLNPEDPNSSAYMVIVSKALGLDEGIMEEWFQKAVKADPLALNAYEEKLDYLQPKWHGTKEKAAGFARWCLENSPEGSIVYVVGLQFIEERARQSRHYSEYIKDDSLDIFFNEIFVKWLNANPKSTSARKEQALINLYRGKNPEALRLLNKALEIDPGYVAALYHRARIYLSDPNLLNPLGAEKDLERVIQYSPDYEDALNMLAHIARTHYKDHKKEIRYLSKAIELSPYKKKLYLMRGQSLLQSGDCESAIKDYSMAINLDPRVPEPYFQRSACYDKLGQNGHAEADREAGRKLVREKKAREFIALLNSENPEHLIRSKNFLDLDFIEEMPVELARVLSNHEGTLVLKNLKFLSSDAAQYLGRHKGRVDLAGLTEISDETAMYLAQSDKKDLRLSGLEKLTVTAASHLAPKVDYLFMDGLAKISPELAKELARVKEGLSLNGLQELSMDTARELSKCRGWLFLNGLTELPPVIACQFQEHSSGISFSGLKNISIKSAECLGNNPGGTISLYGLEALSPEAAAHLARHNGQISLGIKSLELDVAKSLSIHRGSLDLINLEAISPECAKALSMVQGDLDLRGLQEMTPEVAEHLSRHAEGSISLFGLKKVDPYIKAVFEKHHGRVSFPYGK